MSGSTGGESTASEGGGGLAKSNLETSRGHAEWTGQVGSVTLGDLCSMQRRAHERTRSAGFTWHGATKPHEAATSGMRSITCSWSERWTGLQDGDGGWREGQKAFQRVDQTWCRVLLPPVPASGRTVLAVSTSIVLGGPHHGARPGTTRSFGYGTVLHLVAAESGCAGRGQVGCCVRLRGRTVEAGLITATYL